MGFVVKKNPTQAFQVKKGMEVLAGKQFGAHMAHLRTANDRAGVSQPQTMASGNKA
jgi:hypothetical protein